MIHLFIMTKELFLLWVFFFQITATFTAKYNNFSNWNALEKCKTLTIKSFTKLLVIKTIFDNVSCEDSHLNHTISKELHIEESHEQCSNGMEIHNVTRSSDGTFGVYCGNTINIISLCLSLFLSLSLSLSFFIQNLTCTRELKCAMTMYHNIYLCD